MLTNASLVREIATIERIRKHQRKWPSSEGRNSPGGPAIQHKPTMRRLRLEYIRRAVHLSEQKLVDETVSSGICAAGYQWSDVSDLDCIRCFLWTPKAP